MKIHMPHLQGGAVLLATTLILILGSAWLLIINLNSNIRRTANYEQTMNALHEAKQALISYAVTYYEANTGDFGFLPCPDLTSTTGEEGNQEVPCGSQYVNSIGKLPWQSLGLPPLKDGYGQCLWYAVSGSWKGGSNRSEMLNDDTPGTFQIIAADGTTVIAGNTPRERPVAVIIAPGRSINNQNRSDANGAMCEGNEAINYIASNYLDAEVPSNPMLGIRNYDIDAVNPDVIDQFILTNDPESETFNDLMLYVTADEIFNAVKLRNDFAEKIYDEASINNLTYRLTECLAGYGQYNADNHVDDGDGDLNRSLPWPAPFDLTDYRDDAEYDDVTAGSLIGRLPMDITTSNNQIYDTCSSPHICTRPDNKLIDLSTTPFSGFCKSFWKNDSDNPITDSQADELILLWENWKDHIYYVVSEEYAPLKMSGDTDICVSSKCITLNAPGASTSYQAAVVFFSGDIILAQSRSATPIATDPDEKQTASNYLEDLNTQTYTVSDSPKQFASDAISSTFNDILYCVNDDTDETSIGGPPPFKAGRCPVNP